MFNVFESYIFALIIKVFTEDKEIIYWNNGHGYAEHL